MDYKTTVFNVKEQVEVKNNTEKVNFRQSLNIIRKKLYDIENYKIKFIIGVNACSDLTAGILLGSSLFY